MRHALTASSKSVVRLNHFLGLTSLTPVALETYLLWIHQENAAVQLSSEASRLYPEIKKPLLGFVAVHWDRVRQSAGTMVVAERMRAGELPMGGAIMLELAQRLSEPNVMQPNSTHPHLCPFPSRELGRLLRGREAPRRASARAREDRKSVV